MSAIPGIDAQAYEEWPERLRAAGFEVDVIERDGVISAGAVRKADREIDIVLPRHVSGTAAVFMSGKSARRKEKGFESEVIEALRTPLYG